MKKLLLLSLLVLFGCSPPIGELSYFELPNQNEFQRWVEADSLYYEVLTDREQIMVDAVNDEGDNFFNNETKKLKFGQITWSDILEWYKSYQLKYDSIYKIELIKYGKVSSLSENNIEYIRDAILRVNYPLITKFTQELVDWNL